jgi:uncharacterized phage protein gp47/JayE
MALPTPNLDDRQFDQIVEEAVRLIPQYCPEWTNYNPSDPGITLIELFAWMTEMILYRLNKVPDKVFITLLDLIGIKLRPPQPAESMATFSLAEGAEAGVWVPKGFQLATEQSEEGEAIVFETQRDLYVTDIRLQRCFSVDRDKIADNLPSLESGPDVSFDAFTGVKLIDRMLYLGDERFSALKETAQVQAIISCPESVHEDLFTLLEWEYWNGNRWRDLVPVSIPEEEFIGLGKDKRGIAFQGPLEDLEPGEVNAIENHWLRGRLIEIPIQEEETVIDTINVGAMILQEGVFPELCFCNPGTEIYIPVTDFSKTFHPFGEDPSFDYCFYICSSECFAMEDSQVRIEFQLTDVSSVAAPNPSENIRLKWEYWNGKRWSEIAVSSPEGPVAPVGHNFNDTTHAFKASGFVTFLRPKDLAQTDVNGQEGYWVRVRIESGDYGVQGKYEVEEGQWVWKDPRPLRPPAFTEVTLKYHQVPYPITNCLTYNDFNFKDVSLFVREEHMTFQPFEPFKEENPALYLGFEKPFPNKLMQIFFKIEEEVPTFEETSAIPFPEERLLERKKRIVKQDQKVVWEYWTGKLWQNILPKDGTKNFTKSGTLEFTGPNDQKAKREFGEELFWIRARLEMGSYARSPKIQDIRPNTIKVLNAVTIKNEILGSSDGTPDQSFEFSHYPVLKGQNIIVQENEVPPRRQQRIIMREEGDDAINEVRDESGALMEVWVRWHEVDSFYKSSSDSRHYMIDRINGRVIFGDGVRGMIPPQGMDNVMAESYMMGGGSDGNVGADSITTLRQAIAYIDSVTNPYPASGGSDMETLQEAKMRGPQILKNRYRAVTAEDFEWLALRASGNVARAKCLPNPKKEGEVSVVIVPRADQAIPDLTRKLLPTPELLRKVKDFLDERRLVTTKLHIAKPRYIEISVNVEVVLKPIGARVDWLKQEMETNLRRFLHPSTGGPDGLGWPFGRDIHKSDLYHIVESLEGVDYIEDLEIYDEDRKIACDKIELQPDELVHLVNVNIRELAKETML